MTTQIVLSSSNAAEIVSCKVEQHQLPNHPHITAYVRQIPIPKLERLSKIASKPGVEGETARIELVQLSIVNEDGTPVFDPKSPDAVVTLREANGPIFVDLLAIIGKSNNKTKKEIDAEADDAEKN